MTTKWLYAHSKSAENIKNFISNDTKPSNLTGIQAATSTGRDIHIFARKDMMENADYEILSLKWQPDLPRVLIHFMEEQGCALLGFDEHSNMRFVLNNSDVSDFHKMLGR